MLTLVVRLLRSPLGLVDEAADPRRLARLVPRLLLVTAVSGSVFGAVVGAYRGGIQIPFAAVKFPVLLLVPALVALPAIRALWGACEVEVPWARVGLAGLVGVARTALLAAALAPAFWLVSGVAGYHLAVLLLAGTLGLVGLPGLLVVARSVPSGGRRRLVAIGGSVLLLGALTAQTGWLLRPFVARPTAEVTFVRPIEEDVFSSLGQTALSSVGIYTGWEAEPSGFVGRGLRRER